MPLWNLGNNNKSILKKVARGNFKHKSRNRYKTDK